MPIDLPELGESGGGGSLFGVPQFGATAPAQAPAPSTPAPPVMAEPPSVPPSATGAMTMKDLIDRMPPEQRVLYEAEMASMRQQQAQAQAAAAAQAEAARKQAADTQAVLDAPRPPIHAPQYKQLPKAPEPQYRSPLEAFGSPLAGLALVAGLFTRTPATATLNAAAAAMNAQRAGDQQAFENNMATFKAKLEETIRANDMEHQAYVDSWSNRKNTMEEKLADINMKATLYRNQALANSARGGKVSEVDMQINALARSKKLLEEIKPSVSASKPEQQVWNEADEYARKIAKEQGKENDPVFVAEKRAEYFKQFDPKPKAGSRGLSGDDQIKVAEAKARLTVEGIDAREKAKLEREIAVLEAKGAASEARAEKKAKTDKELAEYKARLSRDGQLQVAEFKATEAAKAAQARADEALKREQLRLDARAKEAQEKNALLREKDAQVKGTVGDKLRDTVATVRDLENMKESFKDEYANFAFQTLADAYMWAGSRSAEGSPMALWWGNKEFALTMPLRHALFGATLTGGGRDSWSKTDINPAMSPAQIRAWFDERIRIARTKLDDQINTLYAKGASEDNVRLIAGDYTIPRSVRTGGSGAPSEGVPSLQSIFD